MFVKGRKKRVSEEGLVITILTFNLTSSIHWPNTYYDNPFTTTTQFLFCTTVTKTSQSLNESLT